MGDEMTTGRDDELLQARIDGTLGPGEDAELRERLEGSADTRQRARQWDELAAMIDSLADSAPPSDVRRDVMERIGVRRRGLVRHGFMAIRAGGMMSKKIMVGLAAAAAGVFVLFAIGGFPDVPDTQGAIGAAKRYNTGQMSEGDVRLGDTSTQDFLQTDAFARLIKDPGAVKLLSDASLRAALSDPGVRAALSDPSLSKALADPGVRLALADPGIQQALASPALASALSHAEFRQALANPALASALSDSALRQALTSQAFAQALASPALRQALNSSAFAQALVSPAFAQALASPAFAQALASPAFAQALSSQALHQALNSPGFAQALVSPAFSQALSRAQALRDAN
jgi:hypothetical protein